MKIFISVVHLLLGLLIVVLAVNAQMIRFSKLYYPHRYYSENDLANRAIAAHLEGLRRSHIQDITECFFAITLGIFSIACAIAFVRGARFAGVCLPSITVVTIIVIVYVSRFSSGFDAAAYMMPVALLLLFLGVEVWYMRRHFR